ncbi:unnamed protein product, partial [Vitis vinifera]
MDRFLQNRKGDLQRCAATRDPAPAPALPHSPVVDVPSATPRDPADDLRQQEIPPAAKGSFPPLLRPPTTCDIHTGLAGDPRHPPALESSPPLPASSPPRRWRLPLCPQ